jgi:hypothetical protein
VIFLIAAILSLLRSNPYVGIWCTATPKRGFTSLVSLPSSFNYSVLLRAVSANSESLNRITYPVFVVPIPATYISWVDRVFSSAVLM